MLLTIHNLPAEYQFHHVKSLLLSKCGLSELILDNLILEGSSKKVTVGVSDDGDAAILVRKINGLYLEGQQLYVEDVRKKRLGFEQPFRSENIFKPTQPQTYTPAKHNVPQQTPMMTPQYNDPQAYMQTSAMAMQAPYVMDNHAAAMPSYGMAGGMYVVQQDTPVYGYQADAQQYQSGPASTHQGNGNESAWAQQNQEYQNSWSQQQNNQDNWFSQNDQENPWVRQRSRSPARGDNRGSRWDRPSKPTKWEPRRDRDTNSDRGRRAPSPQRDAFTRDVSNNRPSEYRGNPDYLARHAPPELLQKYQAERQPEYQQPYEPEDTFQNEEPLDRGYSGDRNRSRFVEDPRFDEPRPQPERPSRDLKRRPAEVEDRLPKKFRPNAGFGAGGPPAGPYGKPPAGPYVKPFFEKTLPPGREIPQKDLTWRGQATAAIAKANAPNELPLAYTYYRRAIRNRLDILMGNTIGVPIDEMVSRYMRKYKDRKVLQTCRMQAEADMKVPPKQVKAREKTTAATSNPTENPQAPKDKPPAPKVNPQAPKVKVKPFKQLAATDALPNYPGGDKQIFKDNKKTLKMEFEGEMTYTLDPAEDEALESDLDDLAMIIKEECGSSSDDAPPEARHIGKMADAIAGEIGKIIRLHATKRLLSVTDHLNLRIFPQPKKIRKDVLGAFLRAYGVKSLRKTAKADSYLATVDSYDQYDQLIAMKKATVCENQTITIEPLNLAGPKVKTFHKKSNKNFQADDEDDSFEFGQGGDGTDDDEAFGGAEDNEGDNVWNENGGEQNGEEIDFDEGDLDLMNPDDADLSDY